MGLFSSKKKINFGELFPDPPSFNLDRPSYNRYTGDIDSLINTYERRRNGQDMFDYIKFLFEPQEARVNNQYKDDLAEMEASLNRRGLLDSGVSAEYQRRLGKDKNEQLAGLFGDAKLRQRADIDDALGILGQLFPARFEAGQIPSQYDYFNSMNRFNQAEKRNLATANQTATRPSGIGQYMGPIGSIVGSFFGGPQGAAIGGQLGNMAGGGPQLSFDPQTFSSAGPFDMSKINALFAPPKTTSSSQKGMFNYSMNNPYQGNPMVGNMNRNLFQTTTSRVSSDTPGFSGKGGFFRGSGASGSW